MHLQVPSRTDKRVTTATGGTAMPHPFKTRCPSPTTGGPPVAALRKEENRLLFALSLSSLFLLSLFPLLFPFLFPYREDAVGFGLVADVERERIARPEGVADLAAPLRVDLGALALAEHHRQHHVGERPASTNSGES